VPIQSLFDQLEAGESIDEFLGGFPSLKREQLVVLLARDSTPNAQRPMIPGIDTSKVSALICNAIGEIHRGLRRFSRQPFANHAKTNGLPAKHAK
jgi:hypothetical protein